METPLDNGFSIEKSTGSNQLVRAKTVVINIAEQENILRFKGGKARFSEVEPEI